MKRVKSLNGYTIYLANERDEKKYTGIEAGNFYVYFSSDIRDFGIANSYPEFECGNLKEAIENCGGNYAIAKEICESDHTCVTFEEIEEIEKQLDAMEKENITLAENTMEEYENAMEERKQNAREKHNKYNETMKLVYSLENKKPVKVNGFNVAVCWDCFGYANENNDPVYDIEFKTDFGLYQHLFRVPLNKIVFA